MVVQITYWTAEGMTKGKGPKYKELKNVKELHRFYSHYTDNDYLRIVYGEEDELYVCWDDITQITILDK